MANYYATARSNYFTVKNCSDFEAWCKNTALKFWNQSPNKPNVYAIAPNDSSDTGCWSSHEDEEGDYGLHIYNELAQHLAENEVAILQEVGHEKLRYLVGEAIAIHSSGESCTLSISDIYAAAQKAFGDTANITRAEY